MPLDIEQNRNALLEYRAPQLYGLQQYHLRDRWGGLFTHRGKPIVGNTINRVFNTWKKTTHVTELVYQQNLSTLSADSLNRGNLRCKRIGFDNTVQYLYVVGPVNFWGLEINIGGVLMPFRFDSPTVYDPPSTTSRSFTSTEWRAHRVAHTRYVKAWNARHIDLEINGIFTYCRQNRIINVYRGDDIQLVS